MGLRTSSAKWIEKSNRWQINVQKDGIRKCFYSSTPGRTGQRECNQKADAWLDEGITDTAKKIRALSEEYIDMLKISTSRSHYGQYEGYFNNYINPCIGSVRIERLTPQHLQNVINAGYSHGLSYKTLSNIRACMQNFLKFCRKSKYTTLIAEDITIPKNAPKGERRILQPDELRIVFTVDEPDEMYLHAYRFQLLTGLRPGELIGLQWSDIDDDTVSINRSINVHGEVTRGKNDNARRNFTLTAEASAEIDAQRSMIVRRGIVCPYVFPSEDGEPTKEKHYYDMWQNFCERNGITKISLYEIRHTFVSIAKALPEGYLKQLVGHSKSMDTYGVYSHAVKDDRAKTADMIHDIFTEILSDTEKDKKAE